jgi:import receptor subunit TOM22
MASSSASRRGLAAPSSAPPASSSAAAAAASASSSSSAASSSSSSAAAGNEGILARVGNSLRQSDLFHKSKRAASNTARFSRKLLWSTGKAAWIAGTTFLVLVVPLIIEMDREAQLSELEGHQASLLGAPSQPPGLAAVK